MGKYTGKIWGQLSKKGIYWIILSEKVGGPNTYVCQDTLVSQGLLVFQDTPVWEGTIFCQVFSRGGDLTTTNVCQLVCQQIVKSSLIQSYN